MTRRDTKAWLLTAIAVFLFVSSLTSMARAQLPPLPMKVLDGVATMENPAELDSPFIEQDPFDLVFLDKLNKFAILKIAPLRNPPSNPLPQDEVLKFDFANDSEYTYQVPFSRVVEFKTYNELLIDESKVWLAKKDYSRALRNLLYVYDNGGKKNPEIVATLNDTLFLDATANFREGKYELALSIYEDIYKTNPDIPLPGIDRTLGEVIMNCYEGIVTGHFEDGDYFRARNLLTSVGERYPNDASQLLAEWRDKFAAESDKLIEQARALAAQNKGREAHMVARRANTIFPGRQANKDLYDEIVKQFPIVFVGVNDSGDGTIIDKLENWGARRINRLTQRKMLEFNGISDEGGKYSFIGGVIRQADEIGLKYEIELQPSINQFGAPQVSAYQIATRLLSYADENSPNYKVTWAKILDRVKFEENLVTFDLRFPFVRPESLLQVPLKDQDDAPIYDGAYIQTGIEGDFTTFERNPRFEPVEGMQHPKIIEQRFRDSSDAIDALIRGDIDVVDRPPIFDLKKLKQYPEIEVRSYVVPTVHMLVPNFRNEFVRNQNFRMGLLRGINRENIVNQMMCGGVEISGCEVISGPWPVGTEDNDQLAYGYNRQVQPLEHNLKLGMVLVELTSRMMEDKQREDGVEKPDIKRPPMVLAYPDNFVSRLACNAIAQNWAEIGVAVIMRPLEKGRSTPPDDDWDFLYVAAAMEEPLADATRLMGPGGLATELSAPLEQSLRKLSYSDSWQSACATLRRMHRQSANDLTILPLWQLNEYVAYRNNVREIGRNLVHLYQNVERWNISSTYKGPEK